MFFYVFLFLVRSTRRARRDCSRRKTRTVRESTEPTKHPPRQQSFENERIGQRRRGWVDDEDDAPRRLPLFERRRPVNGVLVRYFRFSHCAAFIISSNLIRTFIRFINSSNFYARFLSFSRETTLLVSASGRLRERHPLSLHLRARFFLKKKEKKRKLLTRSTRYTRFCTFGIQAENHEKPLFQSSPGKRLHPFKTHLHLLNPIWKP